MEGDKWSLKTKEQTVGDLVLVYYNKVNIISCPRKYSIKKHTNLGLDMRPSRDSERKFIFLT